MSAAAKAKARGDATGRVLLFPIAVNRAWAQIWASQVTAGVLTRTGLQDSFDLLIGHRLRQGFALPVAKADVAAFRRLVDREIAAMSALRSEAPDASSR